MIAIIDYGMGNLRSVEKGFHKVGVDAQIVSDPGSVENASGVVLPGVGAFRDCIRNLDDMGLTDPIVKSIKGGKPYLGICLGLQVLFTESHEFGQTPGLDILKGRVLKFPEGGDLKVPHMGWNSIMLRKRPPVLRDIPDGSYMYFVHSYYVSPDDNDIVATTTDYGTEFVSMIWVDNIMAMQFHPEKSQDLGLNILKAFGDFVKNS